MNLIQLGFASLYKFRYRTIPRCITFHYIRLEDQITRVGQKKVPLKISVLKGLVLELIKLVEIHNTLNYACCDVVYVMGMHMLDL